MPLSPRATPTTLPVPSDRIDAFEMFVTARACGAYLPLILDARREPVGWTIAVSRVGDETAMTVVSPLDSPVMAWIAEELARMVG